MSNIRSLLKRLLLVGRKHGASSIAEVHCFFIVPPSLRLWHALVVPRVSLFVQLPSQRPRICRVRHSGCGVHIHRPCHCQPRPAEVRLHRHRIQCTAVLLPEAHLQPCVQGIGTLQSGWESATPEADRHKAESTSAIRRPEAQIGATAQQYAKFQGCNDGSCRPSIWTGRLTGVSAEYW